MYDENFQKWARINTEGIPETPWGILAVDLINKKNIDHDLARETVIISCLMEGESLPLAELFHFGISPSFALLKYIGAMMAHEVIPEKALPKYLPFGLKICNIKDAKSRRPRSKTSGEKHPFIKLRDSLIRENVDAMNEGGGYDAAIAELADLEGLDKETIRSATRKKPPANE